MSMKEYYDTEKWNDAQEQQLKVIEQPLLGLNRWYFPRADKNTMDWYFHQGLTDVNPALEMMQPYLKGKRTAIQAGGAVGIWARRLSSEFNFVFTFEPERINYECLCRNTDDLLNVVAFSAALGKENKDVKMVLEPNKIGHCGAYQVADGGDIPVMRIDELKLQDVDLIYLDVEGSEYDAIEGARETIKRCQPVIGIEEKGFNRRYNNGARPHDLLHSMGYKVIGKPYKDDLLFCAATP